ncbi:MAG TPA: Gfo/Idh/MocA family oxidoreductase [Magnetospirillum sp.]|jgi:predicted dehydrogenase|nr:Gfo/Idh/MocA family oxidoreductase [Magnetospirillum sp.]
MNDVLIIGCGAIAGGYDEGRDDGVIRTHAKAFSRHPGFRPTACVEPDADRRAAFMAAWGIPEGFASLDEVAHRRFAVACVCGPTATHAEILARLLDMDVAVVLAEKPLTEDTAGAARLVAAYAERGRALAVNYLRRFDPAMTALKHDIASGQLGTLQAAVGYYTKGMLNNGSHMVDLLQHLAGPLEPESVHRALVDYHSDDPTLDCTLTTASGAPVHLHGLDRNAFTIFELDLMFEYQRVHLLDSGFVISRQHVVDSPVFTGYRVLSPAEAEPTQFDQAFAQVAEAVHRHLQTGAPLASTGESALAAQAVCTRLIAMARQQGALTA